MTAALDRAEVYLDANRYAEAIRALGSHLAAEPDDARALCLLSRAQLGVEEFAAARASAEQAVALAPGDEWPLRLVSVAQMRLRSFPAARAAAQAACRTAPFSWRTQLQVARVDVEAGTVGVAAWDAASEAVRLAPNEAETHRMIGVVALEMGAVPQAEQAFLTALRLDPHDALAQHDLARVRLRQRNLGAAAAGFADVAAQNPGLGVAVENLTVAVAHVLRVVHLILWAAVFVSARSSGVPALRSVAAVAALIAVGAFATRLSRQTGGRSVRLLTRTLQVDRLLACWASFLALALVGLLVAVGPTPLPAVGLATAAAGLLGGLIVSWTRARRLTRTRVDRQGRARR